MTSDKEENLFADAPVSKAFFKMALPVVMGMAVSLIYNVVDTWFIALTGETNLIAGVSLASPLFTLLTAMGDIWGLGGSSLISRLFGQKRTREASHISAFCWYAAILTGLAFTAVLLIFRSPILRLLGADAQTLPYAGPYYTWIAAGAPFMVLTLVPNNVLRTEGLASEGMIGTIIGSVCNIVLDPILIFGAGLGAAGAAIATVLSNVLSCLYFYYVIQKKTKYLSCSIRDVHITPATLKEILFIGIPASITNLMSSYSQMMLNRSLLPYGNEEIAAMGIAGKVNMIAILIMIGFSFGSQPLIGYNYGAGNKERLREVLRFCYRFVCGLGLAFTCTLSALAPFLIRLFVSDASVIEAGTRILRTQQLSMVFMAFTLVTTCICQSAGKAFGAFMLSFCRQGLFFTVILLLFSSVFDYRGVLLSQPASDLATAALAAFFLHRYMGNVLSSGRKKEKK